MNLLKFFQGVLTLIRPFEWSKPFGNMLIAALVAMYLSNSLDFSFNTILNFLIAFISVGPLLWGGLYALNDWTDIEKDKHHPVKKERPLPSGIVSPNQGLFIAVSFIILSLLVGWTINFLFFVCLIGMLLNQLLYTIPPIKLKEKPVLDLISGSLINPIFRFYAGWVLFNPNFNAPILFLLFILGIQFGGYTLYRLSGKQVEKKLNYKSSVILFGEKNLKLISYASIFIGCASFIFITLSSTFFLSLVFLGSLPIIFLFYGIIVLIPLLVLMYPSLVAPDKIDIKKMYGIVYSAYILFLLGFILIFYLIKLKILVV